MVATPTHDVYENKVVDIMAHTKFTEADVLSAFTAVAPYELSTPDGSLSVRHNRLYTFNTVLCEHTVSIPPAYSRCNGKTTYNTGQVDVFFRINSTRYSKAASKHLNSLLNVLSAYAHTANYRVASNVNNDIPVGTQKFREVDNGPYYTKYSTANARVR